MFVLVHPQFKQDKHSTQHLNYLKKLSSFTPLLKNFSKDPLKIMEEEEDMLPPFWLQTNNNVIQDELHRRLCRSYSLMLNSGALVIVFLAIALSFIFIIIPTFHSFISCIFKPHSVKKGWELLNVALVLFAIFCGFLNRNGNESASNSHDDPSTSNATQEPIKSNPSIPRLWPEINSNRWTYNRINSLKSSTSYPDLRQESPWIDDNEPWRFYDDTHITSYSRRTLGLHGQDQQFYPWQQGEEAAGEQDYFDVKDVEMKTSVVHTEYSASSKSKGLRRKTKKTYQLAVDKKDEIGTQRRNGLEVKDFMQPPPLQADVVPENVEKSWKNQKRGTVTKEKPASLKRNKIKQRQRTVENSEATLTIPIHTLTTRMKKTDPHVDQVISSYITAVPMKSSRGVTGIENMNRGGESTYMNRGNESPSIPLPPPPPPPFKVPSWKFAVQGNYVRINSFSSSGSSSELEDGEDPSVSGTCQLNVLRGRDSLLFPSPDVDTKADNFIERIRAGLRLEQMKSIKEKHRGKSSLHTITQSKSRN